MKNRIFIVAILVFVNFIFISCTKEDKEKPKENESEEELIYPDDKHPHLIDLGLPNGTKWACCNVGANKPEEYGGYYSWGESFTKNNYSWDTYNFGSSDQTVENIREDIAGTEYDTAARIWGAPWRMPNYSQCRELSNNTTYLRTVLNDVVGCKVTGPNGNFIFVPFTRCYYGKVVGVIEDYGIYWSSADYEKVPSLGCAIWFGPPQVQYA